MCTIDACMNEPVRTDIYCKRPSYNMDLFVLCVHIYLFIYIFTFSQSPILVEALA